MIDKPVKPNSEAPSATSSSLIQRAQANDQQAWERLRDLYTPLVYLWCRQAHVPAEDIPDVGQEVFLAVAHNFARFDHGQQGSTFRGWLRRITQNKVADLWRARAKSPNAAGGSDAYGQLTQVVAADPANEDSSLPDEERMLLYLRAVEIISAEFPAWYQAAFLQLVVDGRLASEVAAEFSQQTSAVYNVKARVLRRLREEFAESIDCSI